MSSVSADEEAIALAQPNVRDFASAIRPSESSLRSHYVEICETTLGKKLKDSGNGDIFRYKNPEEYKNEYRRIKKIKGEDALNAEDRIVLNLYQDFLDSMPYNPNRWQYLLEKLARQKNLLMSIDSSGNRVVVQNDFILVVDAYSLYTCFKNEKFSLYQEQVNRPLCLSYTKPV